MSLNTYYITLTPYPGDEYIDRLEVSCRIPPVEVSAGEPVAMLETRIGNVQLTGGISGICLRDESGEVALHQEKLEETAYSFLQLIPDRAPEGALTLSYSLCPRMVDENTHSGPYYDLRCEENGFTFHAEAVFARIAGIDPATAGLSFDLTNMPEGVRVCSNGTAEGYFACGNFVRCDRANLTLVCCSKPEFDLETFADSLGVLHEKMCEFFMQQKHYTVIFRKDPYPSRGGSATADAFLAGYTVGRPPVLTEKYSLLAHEMTHSFVSLREENKIRSAWFNEAVADYVSARFPYEMGLRDKQYYIQTLNEFSKRFFDNPYYYYSVEQALSEAWTDTTFIQPLPYGRGFFILCRLEKLLEGKLAGTVLALLRYCGYSKMNFQKLSDYIFELTGVMVEEEVAGMEQGGEIDLTRCSFGKGIAWRTVPGVHHAWYQFYEDTES